MDWGQVNSATKRKWPKIEWVDGKKTTLEEIGMSNGGSKSNLNKTQSKNGEKGQFLTQQNHVYD